jgi:hypothetical protein
VTIGKIGVIKLHLTIILFALYFVSSASGQHSPRTSIELFSYTSFGASDQTTDVENLLKQKLRRLVDEVGSAHPDLAEQVKKLTVDHKQGLLPDPVNLEIHWKSSKALEILSGGITEVRSGGITEKRLTTNVYLGDLHGSLKTATVSFMIAITPEEYRRYRDVHSALVLYALAMDAKASSVLKGAATQYLAEAESSISSITNPDSDAIALREAIKKEFALLQGTSQP